jgi:hypothetical protein
VQGLTIGLHPSASTSPPGNKKTGISLGLYLTGTIRDAVTALSGRGIVFDGPIVNEETVGMFAYFNDPDGNSLYVAEMKDELKNKSAGGPLMIARMVMQSFYRRAAGILAPGHGGAVFSSS